MYEETGIAFVFLMLSFLLEGRQLQGTASPMGGTWWYPWAGELLGPDLPFVLRVGTPVITNQRKKKPRSTGEQKSVT